MSSGLASQTSLAAPKPREGKRREVKSEDDGPRGKKFSLFNIRKYIGIHWQVPNYCSNFDPDFLQKCFYDESGLFIEPFGSSWLDS
jgi:hypothetical protein